MSASIARLKITLDDAEPPVLRRVEVPLDIRLDRLHLTIQAAMGWENCHLYELRAGDLSWSTPYPEADWVGEFGDAGKARLSAIYEKVGRKKFTYLYDFGDGWAHTLKIERLIEPEAGVLYPRLVEVDGRCPPEDSGGPGGYAFLLKAIRDPADERHEELKYWVGEGFDPDADDAAALTKRVAALARTWSRKPTERRAIPHGRGGMRR
jgi:hypothetical protein